MPSCKSLGLLHDLGQGGPVNRPRAAILYARACDAGEFDACNNLANLHVSGDGVPRDPSRAAALYDRVCAATGRPRPCANATAARGLLHAASHD
jgi:TPR repeat protein